MLWSGEGLGNAPYEQDRGNMLVMGWPALPRTSSMMSLS